MCSASMSIMVGDGASTRLWTDNWASVGPLSLFTPTLFVAVSRLGRRRVLRDALANNRWARDITGAPMTQVLCDYLRVWELLCSVTLEPLQPDRFVWKWSTDGNFSVSSRTEPSSLAPPRYSEPRNFGASKLCPASSYSSGSCYMVGFGPLSEGCGMVCRTTMCAPCATRNQGRADIYSLGACSPGKSSLRCSSRCNCRP